MFLPNSMLGLKLRLERTRWIGLALFMREDHDYGCYCQGNWSFGRLLFPDPSPPKEDWWIIGLVDGWDWLRWRSEEAAEADHHDDCPCGCWWSPGALAATRTVSAAAAETDDARSGWKLLHRLWQEPASAAQYGDGDRSGNDKSCRLATALMRYQCEPIRFIRGPTALV